MQLLVVSTLLEAKSLLRRPWLAEKAAVRAVAMCKCLQAVAAAAAATAVVLVVALSWRARW